MTRLWCVRHGPTHARTMVGWTDLPADLSDSAALARLSAALPDRPVVASTLSRARATAGAIAGQRPRLPDEPDLREIHFGDWENARFDAVPDQAALRAFWEDPGDRAAPNGESWTGFCTRVWAATDRLAAAHPDGLVMVVHMGVIMALIQRAAGLAPYDAMNHRLPPLSLTELSARPGGGTGRIGATP